MSACIIIKKTHVMCLGVAAAAVGDLPEILAGMAGLAVLSESTLV